MGARAVDVGVEPDTVVDSVVQLDELVQVRLVRDEAVRVLLNVLHVPLDLHPPAKADARVSGCQADRHRSLKSSAACTWGCGNPDA